MNPGLAKYSDRLDSLAALRWQGQVTRVLGQMVESSGPFCTAGELCEIRTTDGHVFPGQIVSFEGPNVLSMTYDTPRHVRFGDRIVTWGARPHVRVGAELVGRVINALGDPLDHAGG